MTLPVYPLVDAEKEFCCTGCLVVYQILSSQNALNTFESSPQFQKAYELGLISNPHLQEEVEKNRAYSHDVRRLYFEVTGLWCPACAKLIQLFCSRIKGIISCFVDYSTDLASIEYDLKTISQEKIFSSIASLGYKPLLLNQEEREKNSLALNLRLGVASFASLNIMMLSYPVYSEYFGVDISQYGHLFGWISLILSLPVLFYSAYPIFFRFVNNIRARILGMETLVAMGILSSFVLSLYQLLQGSDRVYFDSMTAIISFVLWGKIMESKAKFSAKSALYRLNRSFPKRGRKRFPDKSMQFVSIKDIEVGNVLVVGLGEKIVMDGVVIEGSASVDESFMTGEAIPVLKNVGSIVLAGSILKSGWIAFEVSKKVEESFYQKIIDTLQIDFERKRENKTLVDKIVRLFVPCILSISFICVITLLLLGYSLEMSVIRGVAILLISCPCAIGIAAPLVESFLTNRLADMGAVLRNRLVLSVLGKEDIVVFDKTGTLTEGKFRVLSGADKLSLEEKSYLKTLSSFSMHPISYAIATFLEKTQSTCLCMEECIGRGVKGYTSENKFYLLGSSTFLQEHGLSIPLNQQETCEDVLISTVYFADDNGVIAVIILGDQLRDGVKQVISALKNKRVIVISGDSEESVCKLAKACEIKEWYALQNPLQKRLMIESFQKEGRVVCMLGDGVNDASSLAAADVGISMLSATDLSVQVSDIFLATNKLSVINKIFALANKCRKIIIQNTFWAFFYNIIGVLLAICGIFSPLIAACAMVASSLIVILNAKRINFRN